jgi:hypothetical protein
MDLQAVVELVPVLCLLAGAGLCLQVVADLVLA